MMLQCGTHRKCLEAASDTDGVPVAGQRHGKGVQRGSRRSSSPEREMQAIANKSRQQPEACRCRRNQKECRVSATVTRQSGEGRLRASCRIRPESEMNR